MRTKCQLCQTIVDAPPELIAQALNREVIIVCLPCKGAIKQNELDIAAYEAEYTERLKQQWAQHQGVTL